MLDQAFKNVCTMVGQCSVNMAAEFLFIMYSIPVNSFERHIYRADCIFLLCSRTHN